MPAGKTSIWLKPETHERWKASGASLADLVERGLDADDHETMLRRVLAEMLAPLLRQGSGRAGCRAPQPPAECAHPKSRVIKGLCGICGTGGLA